VVPPKRRPYNEWGFNMRLQTAMLNSEKHPSAEGAGMGGLGFSLRARPTGHFALDFGLDFIGGRDFHGNRRSEIPFTVNAMLFVNPKDRAQLYFLGGLGWSSAHVERADSTIANYSYFGFQTGVGVEYRATRHLALNLDLIGFMRGRTDRQAAFEPEFFDPATGRTTNTSGGGLFRGGLTVYWLEPAGCVLTSSRSPSCSWPPAPLLRSPTRILRGMNPTRTTMRLGGGTSRATTGTALMIPSTGSSGSRAPSAMPGSSRSGFSPSSS
jgi:hypothetical protein